MATRDHRRGSMGMLKTLAAWGLAGALSAGAAACSDDPKTTDDTAQATDTGTGDDADVTTPDGDTATTEPDTTVEDTAVTPDIVAPAECDHEPACSDQQIASLKLKATASGGDISALEAPEGQNLSLIDASAGGFNGTKGYTYARFTRDQGLVAVELSDEDALDDATWDIAFRRFVIRLNSGVSGPACVLAAQLQKGTEFGGVKSEPAGLTYEAEAYFDEGDSCAFIDDGSGIGGPGSVLSTYWDYISCVAMNGNVYILRLSDGHHVKLQVESYYAPTAQAQCDDEGAVADTSSAGNFRVRWAYLD